MRDRFEGQRVYSDLNRPTLDRLTMTLGLSVLGESGWMLQGSVPFGWLSHDADVGQSPAELSGLGDVRLSAGWRWRSPRRWQVMVTGDVRLPTGQVSTVGVLSSTSMPTVVAIGSGTWSVGAQVLVSRWLSERIGVSAPLRLNLPLSYARNGARPGLGLRYGLSGFYVASAGHVVSAGVNAGWRERARFEDEGTILNSGGHLVAAQVSGLWAFTSRFGIQLSGRVPVWRDLGGRQLSECISASVELIYRDKLSPDKPKANVRTGR